MGCKIVDTLEMTSTSRNTGEVVSYTKAVYDKIDIENRRMKVKRDDELSIVIDDNFGNYYFHFFDNLSEVDIPVQMKTRFLYLCAFMDYKGRLVNTDKGTNAMSALDRESSFDKLGLSRTEFNKTFRILEDNNLIVIVDDKISIVKDFAIRGVLSSEDKKSGFIKVFFDGIKKLYRQSPVRQHKRLYYFFTLLPYINRHHNVVCSNPMEVNEDFIEVFDMDQICRIVGMTDINMSRVESTLLGLKLDDRFVMTIVKRGDGQFIKVNPVIYYGGSDVDDLKSLMGDFKYKIK